MRINPDGKLATSTHPAALGSALTHESITTDFSESLLEFITPPERSPQRTLAQLRDIHKFVLSNLGDERLWPMSMPCYVASADDIPIAQYGTANIAKMKTLYRVGLKNRYGSMMQAIAGVHFNFSLPQSFWQQWLAELGHSADTADISAAYFALIRNYRRFCWLIPYLYGASPSLCGSFLQQNQSSLPFKRLGKGSIYLPYATSLRMSDLGYTNSAQSTLSICYNDVDSYIASLRQAINTPSAEYARFEQLHNGQRQQLNANVLQIENELYSPIRPKQPIRPLEKPTDALAQRGVSYIEVRSLDVNPFSDVGIEEQQFYFLDTLLLYCAIVPSEFFDAAGYQQTERNLNTVVLQGRQPGLTLELEGGSVGLKQWANQIFAELEQVAALLDKVNHTDKFSSAVSAEWRKVDNPELTYSGRLLDHLLSNNLDNGEYGLSLAEGYKQEITQRDYTLANAREFVVLATESLQAQQQLEQSDDKSFEQFLADYFARQ